MRNSPLISLARAAFHPSQDYTAYWQAVQSRTPASSQDYNAYWQQVQAQQAGQQ